MKIVYLIAAVFAASTVQAAASHVLAVDARHSTMTVYVYKEGLFSFAADNHEVNAPIASGDFDESAGKVKVTIDAANMKVLDPKLPADRRAKVQANMVGPQVLDVKRYPTIVFQSTAMKHDGTGHLVVAGNLTLHGQTRPVTVDVTKIDSLHYSGAAVVKQTSFGITPIRIAGGVVRVKDDVKIVFEIALH